MLIASVCKRWHLRRGRRAEERALWHRWGFCHQDDIKNSKTGLKSICWWLGRRPAGGINAQHGLCWEGIAPFRLGPSQLNEEWPTPRVHWNTPRPKHCSPWKSSPPWKREHANQNIFTQKVVLGESKTEKFDPNCGVIQTCLQSKGSRQTSKERFIYQSSCCSDGAQVDKHWVSCKG